MDKHKSGGDGERSWDNSFFVHHDAFNCQSPLKALLFVGITESTQYPSLLGMCCWNKAEWEGEMTILTKFCISACIPVLAAFRGRHWQQHQQAKWYPLRNMTWELGRWLSGYERCLASRKTWVQLPATHVKSWAWPHTDLWPNTVGAGERGISGTCWSPA